MTNEPTLAATHLNDVFDDDTIDLGFIDFSLLGSQRRVNFATRCASYGMRIFPLVPGTKKPSETRYQESASTDPEEIKRWAERYPDCNFGLLMGCGWYVLDIDNHRKCENGFQTLTTLGIASKPRFVVQTPTGKGEHHYYRLDGSDLPRCKLGPGLDFIGKGGYVVAPFSSYNGGSYFPIQGFNDLAEVGELPSTVRQLAEKKASRFAIERSSPARQQALKEKTLTDAQSHRIWRILGKISPSLPRDPWLETVFAAFNVWGYTQAVKSILKEWSIKSKEKWNLAEFEKLVASYDPNNANKLGLPTLRRLGVEHAHRRSTPIEVPESRREESDRLARRAYEEVVSIMGEKGNNPNASHRVALEALTKDMAYGLYSDGRFRKAYPLATGTGKTTACVGLCKAIYSEGIEKSVLMCVEQVEQGDEVRQSLIASGVPGNQIALLHNTQEHKKKYPPIEADQAHSYRYLIACHARAKFHARHGKVERLTQFNGRDRDLILWDESMIRTNGYYVSCLDALIAIKAFFVTLCDKRKGNARSVHYEFELEELERFLDEVYRKLEDAQGGEVIEAMELQKSPSVYVNLIGNVLNDERYREPLQKLVEFSKRGRSRVVRVKNPGCDLIQFETCIDPEFKKVIILDASAPIRELLEYDDEIEVEPIAVTKDYSTVTIRWADVLSSKDSFSRSKDYLRSHLKEIGGLLRKEVPRDEDVLIFCHKDLEDEVLTFRNEQQELRRGTIHVLHWGQHRATNRYADVRWVFTVGVRYLPREAVMATIVGQTGSLEHDVTAAEITSVAHSEQAELLYQGISRGNSRRTIDGKAGKQTIYLFHPKKDYEPVKGLLKEVMPNVQTEEYRPEFLQTGTDQCVEVLASRIGLLLDEVRNDSISCREIAAALEINTNDRRWRNGMNGFQSPRWRKVGKKFVRIPTVMPTR